MALARVSPLLGAISGALGAQIFSQTRRGLIISQRPLKRKQSTPAQQKIRAAFGQLRNDWTDAPNLDRQAYRAAAATITTPDRLATPKHPAPFNILVRQNLKFSGAPHAGANPPILSCSQVATPRPTSFSATLSIGDGFEITADNPDVFLGSIYQVLLVAPCRSGSQTYLPRFWRRAGRKNVLTATTDWTSEINAVIGTAQIGRGLAISLTWIYYFQLPSAPAYGIYPFEA